MQGFKKGELFMRMRTINEAHAELLTSDPGCCLTKTALRRLVVSGSVPSTRVGAKYLVSMEALEEYLSFPKEGGPATAASVRPVEAQL